MMVIRSVFYGGTLVMKMEIIIKIKNDDGSETIEPVIIDTEIPEYGNSKAPIISERLLTNMKRLF